MTTKLCDIERLAKLSEVDPSSGSPKDTEASMVYRRLKIYKFHSRIAKPKGNKIKYCPACFAKLVLSQSGL